MDYKVLTYKENTPKIHPTVFIGVGSVIIGKVNIAKSASIWYNVVIRGDGDSINIGKGTNIQDGSIIHVDPNFPVQIGENSIIGHKSIIHGAIVGNNSLIGMGSTLLNGVKVGNFCLIGANSLLTENMIVPDGSLVLGSPAKIIKMISEDQKQKIIRNAQVYIELAKEYLEDKINR